mmetsp:Transcript_5554/g.14115  ORF Transcript_5554/g.14115 Transcript_5554/m.14115 type:complete len:548 (-) Transcript_5554:148-1791(-)
MLSALFFVSMASRFSLSASAFASASFIMLSTSLSDSVDAPVILISVCLPVPLSEAVTLRIPFASMSNFTSTCGTPRGAGGIPSRRKFPSDLLSVTISRSPWSTLISTLVWPSAAVENTSLFDVGSVVFRGMIFVITPPSVSSPRLSGVTSRSTMSLTSPARTPPCTAAPSATTSSGFTVTFGSRPVSERTRACTAGMRVDPPTRITSLISFSDSLASLSALSTGMRHRSMRSAHSSSNFWRVMVVSMCFGPSAVAVMKGRDTLLCVVLDSSCFVFSAASMSRCSACLSVRRSIPSADLKSSARKSTMRLSKSSPPRWVSPDVESTSNTPSPTSSTLTSNVPPPRSNTRMVSLDPFSNPYASEAAVGSLMMRSTSIPAILPASLVACRWLSLKYAGTVMTALSTFSPRNFPASSQSLRSTCAEISSAANSLSMLLHLILTFPFASRTTSYGTCVHSEVTSSMRLPMNRLTLKKVFSGFTTACRLAICPTSWSPVLLYATTDGVVRCPSALVTMVGFPPSIAATALLVVPKSIPTTFSARARTEERREL